MRTNIYINFYTVASLSLALALPPVKATNVNS